MFLRRVFRFTELFTACAMLLLALTSVGMCQNTSVPEEESKDTDTIEEIIVYGDKSLIRLRLELYRAEEKVFVLFNSLNSDDEFDIHCYKEAPTGSHIMRRVCKANYERKLIAEATSRWLLSRQTGTGVAPGFLYPAAKIQQKAELLHEEMESLVVENPELLKVLSEFSEAKRILESERQRRCEGRIFICRR